MRALLSPEARFLLLTAGGSANDSALREVLDGPFDWAELETLARADRATPVVWRTLQRLGYPVPHAVADALHRATVVAEFELLRGEVRLGETVEALATAGIGVVLLKGVAMAHTVYRSFAERPMCDFDLLVEPERIDDAKRIVLLTGWGRSRGAGPDRAYDLHHHAAPLIDRCGTGLHLELHTSLFTSGHPFGLSPELVRARSALRELNGCVVRVPDRSILLLHACLHLAWSHAMRGAGWRTLRDVGRLADGRPGFGDELVHDALQVRGATCSYWVLRLARDLATIPIPRPVLEALAPPVPELVRARIARHFALHLLGSRVACPSARVNRAIWEVAVRPRWSGHRSARPWDRDHEFASMLARGPHDGGRGPGYSRGGSVGQWRRYLATMLASELRGARLGRWRQAQGVGQMNVASPPASLVSD